MHNRCTKGEFMGTGNWHTAEVLMMIINMIYMGVDRIGQKYFKCVDVFRTASSYKQMLLTWKLNRSCYPLLLYVPTKQQQRLKYHAWKIEKVNLLFNDTKNLMSSPSDTHTIPGSCTKVRIFNSWQGRWIFMGNENQLAQHPSEVALKAISPEL